MFNLGLALGALHHLSQSLNKGAGAGMTRGIDQAIHYNELLGHQLAMRDRAMQDRMKFDQLYRQRERQMAIQMERLKADQAQRRELFDWRKARQKAEEERSVGRAKDLAEKQAKKAESKVEDASAKAPSGFRGIAGGNRGAVTSSPTPAARDFVAAKLGAGRLKIEEEKLDIQRKRNEQLAKQADRNYQLKLKQLNAPKTLREDQQALADERRFKVKQRKEIEDLTNYVLANPTDERAKQSLQAKLLQLQAMHGRSDIPGVMELINTLAGKEKSSIGKFFDYIFGKKEEPVVTPPTPKVPLSEMQTPPPVNVPSQQKALSTPKSPEPGKAKGNMKTPKQHALDAIAAAKAANVNPALLLQDESIPESIRKALREELGVKR